MHQIFINSSRLIAVCIGMTFVGAGVETTARENVPPFAAIVMLSVTQKAPPPVTHLRPEVKFVNANMLHDRTKQAVWIEVTKDAVRTRLKDPESAQFRNVAFRVYRGKTPIVCGEVNGRNGFGGYSGFQHFIASGKSLVYLESDFQAGEFNTAWNEMCLR